MQKQEFAHPEPVHRRAADDRAQLRPRHRRAVRPRACAGTRRRSGSGRFISQNAVIKTTDLNPVFSYQLFPELSIAAGADYRFSGLQLERNTAAINPFTQSVVDVAHIKLYSDLTSNGGWGLNAGIMWKPVPAIGVGASYRSKITINYEGTATVTQRPTGNAVFDPLVAAQLRSACTP